MSFSDTVAQDYKITDSTETATFISKNESGPTSITITNADSHAFTAREVIGAQGLFGLGDRKWFLGNDQIPAGKKPKAGDSITGADGVTWEIVMDATLDDFSVSWECTTRKAR